MENPTGQGTIKALPVVLDGVFVSPDCAIIVDMAGEGVRLPVYFDNARIYGAIAALVRPSFLVPFQLIFRTLDDHPRALRSYPPDEL